MRRAGWPAVEQITLDNYMTARITQSAKSQTGAGMRFRLSTIPSQARQTTGAPIYKPSYKDFTPHVGFAWNPGFDKKMVFNGGIGMGYDRTIINAVQFIQDANSYLFQQQSATALGISGDPYDSIKTDPRLDSNNQISNVHLGRPADAHTAVCALRNGRSMPHLSLFARRTLRSSERRQLQSPRSIPV